MRESLINILENVIADPYKYSKDGNLFDHVYAFILLGHFKETRAHQVIVDLFLDLLANVVCDLHPEEIMDVIKQAYEDDLIIPKIIQYSEFEDALKIGKNKCLEKIKSDFERQNLDDIHEAMSWWSCFEENPESAPISSSLKKETFLESSVPATQKPGKSKNIARRKRKKRKQAKDSKQKIRR